MLSNAGLTNRFWVEVVTYAGHLISILPFVVIKGKTLIKVWSSNPATDYDSLKFFDCPTFFNVTEDIKLDLRA